MSHATGALPISAPLLRAIHQLPVVEKNGLEIVENFGIFIDTHRDQPHVGTFTDDIHRGHCRPMPVDYIIVDDMLRNPENGNLLQRHEKHLFIQPDTWTTFLVDSLMTTGADPRSGDGTLPTTHFRDARKKIYLLRSFRQMVWYNHMQAMAAGTLR